MLPGCRFPQSRTNCTHPPIPGLHGFPGRSITRAGKRLTRQHAAAVADSVTAYAGARLVIPRHWEEQIAKAPLGRRRVLDRYLSQVAAINSLEPAMRALSDGELAQQTLRFREQLRAEQHRMAAALDELLPQAFATVREASRRVLGLRHFDSQLVGGMVLHEGQIAEMATGEGKTLVAVLPAYLNALPATLANPPVFAAADPGGGGTTAAPGSSEGQGQPGGGRQRRGGGVHVVTVNDYLAARDADWMGKVFRFLGLTVGAVQSNCSVEAAQAAYGCHVTYVTGQELCFNYLKDNTATSAAELMLPEVLEFAVVDEVDSILIDESRNPMIISQPRGDTAGLVVVVDRAVRRLWALIVDAVEVAVARQPEQPRAAVEATVKARYLVLDAKQRSLSLSQQGMSLLFTLLAQEPGVTFSGRPPCVMDLWEGEVPWGAMAVTALKAYQYFQRGVQYIVREGAVVIVDESTGRVRPISRYSGGLHQAIEAKEGVEVKPDSHATASITFQVFFRFYRKLAGMTGTAAAAAAEFYEIYGLVVVPIPTNMPPRRQDLPLRLYYTEKDKLAYVVSTVESCWAAGRPVLIGTSNVNESEAVLRVLQGWCRPAFRQLAARVQLLNAKPENVRLEAQIVAQAGLPAAVTIATNMAGRGTDIILGGNPEGLTRLGLLRLVYRWLLPPDTDAAGDGASGLDALSPPLPLEVFSHYEGRQLADVVRPRPAPGAGEGLPAPLHLALLAAMMFAGVAAPAQQGLAHDDLRQLAAAALSAADVARRATLRRLRDTFGAGRLQDLNFIAVVAPAADAVFDQLAGELAPAFLNTQQGEPGSSHGAAAVAAAAGLSPELRELQRFSAKAALLLWLWFDQECEGMAEQVVAAGGLLVLGTSLQEGARIELQLRGRAGRQGDPGSTQLLFDLGDPLFAAHGMQSFQQLAGSWLSSGQLLPYQESVVVDLLHKEVQRSMESQWQMARLETKKYDEVLEVYRRNLYSLRRLILTGNSQQRLRVVHLFIQQWADALVARLIDADAGPAAWTAESLEQAAACAPQTAPATARGAHGSGSNAAAQQPGRISPLGALMWHVEQLVNPAGRVARGGGAGDPRQQQLPVVAVLTPEQLQQLAGYLVRGEPLPWPRPRFAAGLAVHLALAAHARLLSTPSLARFGASQPGQQQQQQGGSSSGSDSDVLRLAGASGLLGLQRPPVTGRHADKVCVLRDYLGAALVAACHQRQAGLQQQLAAASSAGGGPGLLDLDVALFVDAACRGVMLEWVDALWSCFLEDVDKLRHAVGLKAYSSQQPVDEFRLEANKAFLLLLGAYRDAMVARLVAPDLAAAAQE